MQALTDTAARVRRGSAHAPVENGTADGKTRIGCAGTNCAGWDPQPCDSRREAQFWYDRHVAQPLIHQIW